MGNYIFKLRAHSNRVVSLMLILEIKREMNSIQLKLKEMMYSARFKTMLGNKNKEK